LLSPEVQEKLPDTEVMFPVNSQAQLPDKWRTCAVIPPSPVMIPLDVVSENADRWLDEWARLVVTGR
jgi:thiamine transport system substrate-binding protein